MTHHTLMTRDGPGKVCTKCGEFKLYEGNYPRSTDPSGYHTQCSDCRSIYYHTHYQSIRDQKIAYVKARAKLAKRDNAIRLTD